MAYEKAMKTAYAIALTTLALLGAALAAASGCASSDAGPGPNDAGPPDASADATDATDAGAPNEDAASDASNTSDVDVRDDYCARIMANCTGSNAQYASLATCAKIARALPFGALPQDNSVLCRSAEADLAASAPAAHCWNAGPFGHGPCGGACTGFCDLAMITCGDAGA